MSATGSNRIGGYNQLPAVNVVQLAYLTCPPKSTRTLTDTFNAYQWLTNLFNTEHSVLNQQLYRYWKQTGNQHVPCSQSPPDIDDTKLLANSHKWSIIQTIKRNRCRTKSFMERLVQRVKNAEESIQVLEDVERLRPKFGGNHSHMSGAFSWSNLVDFILEKELYYYTDLKKFDKDDGNLNSKKIAPSAFKVNTSLSVTLQKLATLSTKSSNNDESNQDPEEIANHFFKSFDIRESILKHVEEDQQITVLVKNLALHNKDYQEFMHERRVYLGPEFEKEYADVFDTTFIKEINGLSSIKDKERIHSKVFERCDAIFESVKLAIENSAKFAKRLAMYEKIANHIIPEISEQYPVGDHRCPKTIRYVREIDREKGSLFSFFCNAVAGYLLISRTKMVRSISIVGDENSKESQERRLVQHGIMFYLKKKFNYPHLNPHCGEIHANRRDHTWVHNSINDALFISDPDRLGHALAIAKNDDMDRMLDHMHKKGKAVEVAINSQKQLSGYDKTSHPLKTLIERRIALLLDVDDEGTFKTSITHEFVHLWIEYGLKYSQILNITRNSLHYSYLQASEECPSIYICNKMSNKLTIKPDFLSIFDDLDDENWTPPPEIANLLNNSPRAYKMAIAERKLAKFEADIARRYEKNVNKIFAAQLRAYIKKPPFTNTIVATLEEAIDKKRVKNNYMAIKTYLRSFLHEKYPSNSVYNTSGAVIAPSHQLAFHESMIAQDPTLARRLEQYKSPNNQIFLFESVCAALDSEWDYVFADQYKPLSDRGL